LQGRNLAKRKPIVQLLLNGICIGGLLSCAVIQSQAEPSNASHIQPAELFISKADYENALYGFWLGQSIANWTGLVTEMDKIGNIGQIKTGDFYTSKDWGKADQASIWGQGIPSNLSKTIDFVFAKTHEPWGADDDTDIEFIYQALLEKHNATELNAEQIRDGWLKHIYSSREITPYGKDPEGNFENYLWVSNQTAHDLMLDGMLPPSTGLAENNPHYDMIDAQLTTEIFGLFAPGKPDIALKMSDLPIRTVASGEATSIAEFYVVMYSLAANFIGESVDRSDILWMANIARTYLPNDQYPVKMYDFVLGQYLQGHTWEQVRNAIYQRYQVEQLDGYTVTSRDLYCNGCFAAGINFASSLVSLFFGEGDYRETIKIATLAGWDSDNPAATWGGMLGLILGKVGLEKTFNQEFSTTFNIHRTRRNFPNNGIVSFKKMASTGVGITERVLLSNNVASVRDNNWIIKNAVTRLYDQQQ
jgi:hypothetical protein